MNSTKLKPDYLPIITGIIIAILVITFTSYVKLTTNEETKNLIVGSVWTSFACIQIFFWLRT